MSATSSTAPDRVVPAAASGPDDAVGGGAEGSPACVRGGLRRTLVNSRLELAWAAFCVPNLAVMLLLKVYQTVPFHFIWISLTLVYGVRVWQPRPIALVLGLVT